MIGMEHAVWTMSAESELPERPPTEKEFEAAADLLLDCWQVLPVTLPRFRQWCGDAPWAAERLRRLEARSIAAQELVRAQLQQLEAIAAEFGARNIPFVLLKSTALRFLSYTRPEQRCGQDLDIGVSRANLGRTLATLEELGYERSQWIEPEHKFVAANQASWSSEFSIVEAHQGMEEKHFELGFLVRMLRIRGLSLEIESAIRLYLSEPKRAERACFWRALPDGGLACYVVIDVHFGIAREIAVDPILESSRILIAGNSQYRVPRPAWLLFHVIFKTYWEGAQAYLNGGYQYADLCRLVNLLDAVEIAHFAEIVKDYHFEAGVYFVLRRIEPEFGVKMAVELTDLMRQAAKPDVSLSSTEQNDLGDMWGKLWGAR